MNRGAIVQLGLGTMLMAVLTRAAAMYEPFPGWDGDPLAGLSAITGLGPTACLFLDAITVLAGALVLVADRGRPGWASGLGLLAAVGVVARSAVLDWSDAEPLPVAGAWASGAVAFAAACCVARRPALRRFAIAIVLGFLCVLLAKSAGQLLFEHPAVVASFDLNRDAALASRGFEPGSASALQFERRLRQPDITAWFGLSNVLAAFLVAGALGAGAVCWTRRDHWKRPVWIAVLALTVLCAIGVLATGSKAGLLIMVLGAGVLAVAGLGGARLGLVAAIGLWLLPVAAIVGRGAVGTASDELSLLVRWFYVSTAAEIGVDRLPWGTGIDGFRAAYAMGKPAIATETVTSSHNAIADWFAMLGVAGIPFVAMIASAAWFTARGVAARSPTPPIRMPGRPTVLGVAIVLAVPVAVSAWLEVEATPLELAMLRLVGLLGAIAVACCVFALRPGRAAAAIVGLALLTHAQLDMVLFQPGSISIAMLGIGLAAGRPRGLSAGRPLAFVAGVGVAAVLVVMMVRVRAWETPLRDGFDSAQAAVVLRQAAADWGGFGPEQQAASARLIEAAAASLDDASRAMPGDPRALLSLAELRIRALDDPAGAIEGADRAAGIERSSRTLGRLGAVAASAGDAERARRAWAEAAELDPQSPHFPGVLAVFEAERGKVGEARRWAAEAIARDANFELDPIAGLPENRRRELEELVKGADSGS